MIHHGDCIEVMATFDAESIDAIVTDPKREARMSNPLDPPQHLSRAGRAAWYAERDAKSDPPVECAQCGERKRNADSGHRWPTGAWSCGACYRADFG
jgi:hypothetical protein